MSQSTQRRGQVFHAVLKTHYESPMQTATGPRVLHSVHRVSQRKERSDIASGDNNQRPQLHRYTFAPSSTRRRVRTGIARAAALTRLCRGLLDWRSAVSSRIAQRCMCTPAAEASLMRPSAGTPRCQAAGKAPSVSALRCARAARICYDFTAVLVASQE